MTSEVGHLIDGYGPGTVPTSPPDHGPIPPDPGWTPDPDSLSYVVPVADRDGFVARVFGRPVPGRFDLPMRHPDDPEKFARSVVLSVPSADGETARVDVVFRPWGE